MEQNEETKEKVKNWLKNPYNLTFLGILILAIIIRLYFLSVTAGQPLWWDEAGYMSYAKNLAGINTGWILTGGQISLFPYIASIFFMFGLSELMIKFLLIVLPSILLVILTYRICLLMYEDKKVALISSFLMATFWAVLFNSFRFHVGIPSLLFGFLALYVFWKGYEKKEKFLGLSSKWAIPATVFLVLLTFSIRRGYFFFGFFFLIYLLLTQKPKDLLRDKYNWIALVIFVALFFILQTFLFPASAAGTVTQYYNADTPISLLPFGVFSSYFKNISSDFLSPLFYLFWFGVILLVLNLVLSIGHIRKSEKAKSDLFTIIIITITLSYFLFFQKQNRIFGEPRWYFPILLGTFISISKSTLWIEKQVKKYSKIMALILIVLLIGYGGYYEFKHADQIIKDKVTSYQGVKDSALFIKSIARDTDIIISPSPAQTSYYAEIKTIHYGELNRTLEDFLSEVKENKDIRFVLVSFWEPYHPEFIKKQSQSLLEIPFMDSFVSLNSNQQNIVQEKSFGEITFKILNIMDGVFVYEVIR